MSYRKGKLHVNDLPVLGLSPTHFALMKFLSEPQVKGRYYWEQNKLLLASLGCGDRSQSYGTVQRTAFSHSDLTRRQHISRRVSGQWVTRSYKVHILHFARY